MNPIEMKKVHDWMTEKIRVSSPVVREIYKMMNPHMSIQAWLDVVDGSTGRKLKDYVATNAKIQTIKVIRTETGWGLKESKDFVDTNWDTWIHAIAAL